MLLGALLGAGLDLADLERALARLGLDGYDLAVNRVVKAGLPARKFEVRLLHPSGRHHSHASVGDGPSLTEIDARLAAARLPEDVTESASRVFHCLAHATARIEGLSLDALRFDEREILDTYIDVVGVAYALHALAIERLYCGALPLVDGVVETRHGPLTLPHPVTREIVSMAAVPSRSEGEGGEQVTPTAAAILATLADFDAPSMHVRARGTGAGDADLTVPNVVRVLIGDLAPMDGE
jgi:uncharacterized protein (DUF111 family)